jgi:plastocyanin
MNSKRTALVALVAFWMLAVAPARAANANVTIAKAGFVPATVTIGVGESVTFTNSDTTAHQVVFSKTTGITCTPNPLALQPTQSGSCTLAAAGTYAYRDPTQKGNFKGTVVVQGAAASVTLAVSPKLVVYGGKVTLTGTVSSHAAGEKVTVQAQQCGENAAKPMATVTTTSGGAYSYAAQPLRNSVYTVKWKTATGTGTTVSVRPRLQLGKVAPHRYSVRVYAADSFAGKVVSFQRYNRLRSIWVTVKRVTLRPGATAVSPTIVSSATFGARVAVRSRVRVVLAQAQAAPCYLLGRSNLIYS